MKRRSFQQADHIRLKLQWLDEHFQPQQSLLEKMFSTTPILSVSIAFILGILVSSWVSPSPTGVYVVATAAALAGLLLIASFRLSCPKRLYTVTILAIGLFLCLGVIRSWAIQYQGPDDIGRLVQNERVLATVRGRVISPIRYNHPQQGFSSIPWLSSQSSFYLAVCEVHTADGWKPTSGKIRVQVTGNAAHVRPGNDVEITCWLSGFSPPANPGQFDLAEHMHRRGVSVTATTSLTEGVEVLASESSTLYRSRSFFYQFAADSLLDETMTDSDVRALSAALLLGKRGDLNPVIVAAFRKTNLSHFISLSGMHVAILAGSLWYLLRTIQIPKRPRAVLCLVLILIYALIVPPRAPTMRAVFLSCFFFASRLIHRPIQPLNTLALSALVLLFVRPYELYSAGWQLSFLSVLGILLLYRTVHYYLLNTLFYPCVLLFDERFVGIQHFLYRMTELLAVGFSAWIVISPILLYYFGQVNPLSPVWTVLALPFVTVILYTGFLKIILATVLPTLASLLGVILNMAAKCLEALVTILAKIDLFHITCQRPSPAIVFILYFLLITVLCIPGKRLRLQKACLLLLIFFFFLPGICGKIENRWNRTLEMTCLSVGHGQAIVVSTPGRECLLFDAGSITHQHLARKTICPFLQNRSIFGLDAVCISHGDLDHLNGVPYLAASIPIQQCYANAALIENSRRPSLEKQFGDILGGLSLPLEPVSDFSGSDYTIRNLWPDGVTAYDATISENDKSQVVLIEYAGKSTLLCGDIETYAQRQFLNAYPDLKVDVMVLPHHGSTNNLDEHFIEQLSPSVVIASCSRRNAPRAYHPPEDSDTQAFYTAIDGAVTVKIKADGTLSADGFLKSNQ